METVVVPHLEIDLHVLSGHDAEAVHVEMVEEGGAGLLLVEGNGNDILLFDGFPDQTVEVQLGEAIVVGNEAREIHVIGELLVERLHTDVGIGVGQHVDGKAERVEGAVPGVLHLYLKLGGLCRNELVLIQVILS